MSGGACGLTEACNQHWALHAVGWLWLRAAGWACCAGWWAGQELPWAPPRGTSWTHKWISRTNARFEACEPSAANRICMCPGPGWVVGGGA